MLTLGYLAADSDPARFASPRITVMRMLPAARGNASAAGMIIVSGFNTFTYVAARYLIPLASRWQITPPSAEFSSEVAATPFLKLDFHQLVIH